jgi:hypothetical protein
MQFLKKKKIFQLYFYPSTFVIKTLDPDPDSLETLGPDPNSMSPDAQHWI